MNFVPIVTKIPIVDKSSEQELLSLLGNWYEPESFELLPCSPWSFALSVLLFYCGTLFIGQSSYVFLLYPVTNQ